MSSIFENGGFLGTTPDLNSRDRYVLATIPDQVSPVITYTNYRYIENRKDGALEVDLTTSVQPGDLVIMFFSDDDGKETIPWIPSDGYSALIENTGGAIGYAVYYKFMGEVPDTIASVFTGGEVPERASLVVSVFRGVSQEDPFFSNSVVSSNGKSGMPDPPALPFIDYWGPELIISAGFLDDDRVASSVGSQGSASLLGASQSLFAGSTTMVQFQPVLDLTMDPPQFSGPGTDAWSAVSFPLRNNISQVFGNTKKSGIWNLKASYEAQKLFIPDGQAEYTTPGTYSWTAPAGVTSVSAVAVGGGGGGVSVGATGGQGGHGGGGGGLGWTNNISVIPGSSYTVVVGSGGNSSLNSPASNGGDSYFINTSTLAGFGGQGGADNSSATGGAYAGDGGGFGGSVPSHTSTADATGGGGAGGYSGKGGDAGTINSNNAQGGLGGGGGGGGAGGSSDAAGAGGGVGIYGQGSNGSPGTYSGNDGTSGSGGSGGQSGAIAGNNQRSVGGNHGGGGGGSDRGNEQGSGGDGAVRIIWGTGRAFPSTYTENL